MIYKKELAENIRRLRENCGYTQKQMADALNIDRSTYSYYELGKIFPPLSTIYRLAKIFHVEYTDILESESASASLRDVARGPVKYFSASNNLHTYELTKDEQNLIVFFRLLPAEEQESLLCHVKEKMLRCAAEEKDDKGGNA